MIHKAARFAVILGLSVGAFARPAFADDKVSTTDGDKVESLAPVQFGPATRGSALPALYVSLAALQGIDAYTTLSGTRNGARETNPLLGKAAGNSAAMWAIKGGVTATSIVMAEK